MNKYLMKRLEEANLSPRIENFVFVTAEAMRGESPSDTFQEFMDEDTDDIIKTLGWKETDEVKKMIESEVEDKSLAFLMIQNARDGFLAEVQFEEMRNIRFDEAGNVQSWSSGGVYYVHWIYAHTVGELVEKILEKDEEEYKEMVEKAKKDLA